MSRQRLPRHRCEWCSTPFDPIRRIQRFCSAECYRQRVNAQNGKRGSRWKALVRDGFRCRYCGASPVYGGTVTLQVDHVIPPLQGGTNELTNLITACSECNASKNDDRLPPTLEAEVLQAITVSPLGLAAIERLEREQP